MRPALDGNPSAFGGTIVRFWPNAARWLGDSRRPEADVSEARFYGAVLLKIGEKALDRY